MARASTLGVRAILDEIIVRSGFAAYLEAMADGASRRQNVAELFRRGRAPSTPNMVRADSANSSNA